MNECLACIIYKNMPPGEIPTLRVMHQTFGVDVGRSLNPLMSWDVMQYGFFHSSWDYHHTYWPKDGKTTGTVKLKPG